MSQRWVILAEAEGNFIALDTLSIESLAPNIYRVWVTTKYSHDEQMAGVRYRALRKLVDYNCNSRLHRIHRILLLDASGRQVFLSQYPNPEQAQYVSLTPDTMSEAEYLRICSTLRGR